METATLYIQCTVDEKVGTFLKQGDILISPICRDSVELFKWMKDNGWKLSPYDNYNYYPSRVVKQKN